MHRVLQSKPAEATITGVSKESPEQAATSIGIGSLSSVSSELTGNTSSVGAASPEPVKSAAEDQSSSGLAGSEPSLGYRRCNFASSSLPLDDFNWEWLDNVLTSTQSASTGVLLAMLMHSAPVAPAIPNSDSTTVVPRFVVCESSQTENAVMIEAGIQTTVFRGALEAIRRHVWMRLCCHQACRYR